MKRQSCQVLFLWPNYTDKPGKLYGSDESRDLWLGALQRSGLDSARCRHETILEKPLPHGVKPSKSVLTASMSRVWALIVKLRPDVVVPVGSVAFQAVCPSESLMEWGGRNVSKTLLSARDSLFAADLPPIVPVYHPDHAAAYPMRKREVDSQLVEVHNNLARKPVFKDGVAVVVRKKQPNWEWIKTVDALRRKLTEIESSDWPVAFDFETTGLDPFAAGARIRCVGFCAKPGEAFVADLEAEPKLLSVVQQWLLGPQLKVCHNAKFEIRWCRRAMRLHPRNVTEDTLLLHSLLYEESSHRLELLAQQHTPIGGYDDELKFALAQGADYATVAMEKLWYYCCGDVDATQRLLRTLTAELRADPDFVKLDWLYRKVVIQTAHTLAVMEDNGLYVNEQKAKEVEARLTAQLEENRLLLHGLPEVQRAKVLLGMSENEWFNTNSPPQVACLLFDVLGLPGIRSTNKERLAELLDSIDEDDTSHVVLKKVRETRTIESDLKELREVLAHRRSDGRINTNFRQDVAVTGRLSSSNPNLQNLRVGGSVRSIFTSRFAGGSIVQSDFSQLEVRLFGGESGDASFAEAYRKGFDIHAVTASKLFRKPMNELSKVDRNRGKRVNFGMIFGIGAKKLAGEVKVQQHEAQGWLNLFYASYPAVDHWKQDVVSYARRHKRIVTSLGRVRHLPEIHSTDLLVRLRAERQAVNTRIQGLGADLTLWCMNNVAVLLKENNCKSVLVGQVHDSLIVDAHPDEVKFVAYVLKTVMEVWTAKSFPFLKIPLKADVSGGPSLLDEKPIKVTRRLERKSTPSVIS